MTLLQLLPSAATSTDAALKAKWLVMPASLKDTLLAKQAEFGDAHNLVIPLELTDGRWTVCADVLTETSAGGIFAAGFSHLDQSLFADVDVLEWSAVEALIPKSEESLN